VVVYASEDAAGSDAAAGLREAGAEVVGVKVDAEGRADARAALEHLAREKGATNVLCEAGGRLSSALVRAGLVDELLVFTAPLVFGDASARAALSLGELARLTDAPRFELRAVRRVGEDVMSVYGAGCSLGRPSVSGVSPGTE
jgi:diaminohydroxyphosphoribosylaminopyrimidine deaminase/5-amino-6-(5-phosphoribosylamino)uracil reductase